MALKWGILNMEITAYHVTSGDNAKGILANGYIPKMNSKHYLGSGSYFFGAYEIAKLYADSNGGFLTCCDSAIVESSISISEDNFLDLDVPANLFSFEKYLTGKLDESVRQGVDIEVKLECNGKKDAKQTVIRYFFNVYKRVFKFIVVSKIFAKSAPPYSFNRTKKYWGFQYTEKYICVDDSSCISKTSIIYTNNQNEEMIV